MKCWKQSVLKLAGTLINKNFIILNKMERFEKIETFSEYEKLAEVTCTYPDSLMVVCVTLGLCGETGEMFEKIQVEQENDEELKKEAGDILWYLAMIHKKMGLPEVNEWLEITDLTTDALFDPIVSMGKIAEQVKKHIRDNWDGNPPIVLSDSRKEVIFEEWKKVLKAVTYIVAKTTGTSIKEVAAMNINKLYDRMERNKIHGEGDNR